MQALCGALSTLWRVPLAAAAWPFNWSTILPVSLFAVVLVLLLIKVYRERQDILDVEEPDSPEDLLRSFEDAHRAGDLDNEEFERVKKRLGLSMSHGGAGGPAPATAINKPSSDESLVGEGQAASDQSEANTRG
jgi:uncharacterized membrane protein